MLERSIDPAIRRTFVRRDSAFSSCSAGGFTSCPPYTVASIASRRLVEGAQLEMPEGYNENTLAQVRAITGAVGQNVRVTFRQAAELALIGFQIQDLNERGMVQPPLGPFEAQNIGHLVAQVCDLNFDGMQDPSVTLADIAYVQAAVSKMASC
ncbi:MAG TPA: hypothetical protein VLI54_05435 [Bacillota bacterium]|nr:hypothetical protein [Bacillota bacterium]